MGPAAPVIMAIGAIVSAGTAAYSASQQSSAAKTARRESYLNQQSIKAEKAEQARRLALQNTREFALANARSWASGVRGATPGLYLDEMARLSDEEISWIEKSSLSLQEIEGIRGEQAERIGKAGAISTIGQGLSSSISMGTDAWYRAYG